MKAFLHCDSIPSSQSWHNQLRLNLEKYMKVVQIDMHKPNVLKRLTNEYRNGDIFFARIKHPAPSENPPYLLDLIKPIYKDINKLFKCKCFPSLKSIELFDDKLKQHEVFRQHNFPTPRTQYVTERDQCSIGFPAVCKKINGASSKNVWLANSIQDVATPCLVQEYHHNNGDVRINVIGNRVLGYLRGNRDNDFRASGSGKLSYPDEMPIECVHLAYRISKETNLMESMAYDFIKSTNGHWMVLEMSYTYVDDYIKNCTYYYDMEDNAKKKFKPPELYPEEMIVEDMIKKLQPTFI